jgi:hypothetical protein
MVAMAVTLLVVKALLEAEDMTNGWWHYANTKGVVCDTGHLLFACSAY